MSDDVKLVGSGDAVTDQGVAQVYVSGTAAVINSVSETIGENIQAKGFREDWDLATKLEQLADEYPEIDIEEAEDIVRRAASALRTNVIGMKLALIASEIVGEGLETLRDVGADGVLRREGNLGEELADGVIRIGDLAHMIGSPLGDEIVNKIAVNEQREHKHGRKA